MSEKQYVDYASVRDALLAAKERRGEISYEQQMALNHAIWASSEERCGIETDSAVFEQLMVALLEVDKLASSPDTAAKIAELLPTRALDVQAILATKRVVMDADEAEHIVTLVRQHVGFEG